MLERVIRLTLPRDEQDLLQACPTRRRPRLHATLDDVHRQRSLLTVPDLETLRRLRLIRADGLKVVAGCGFVVDYLQKHPEYAGLEG